jgi:hypothetical protein
MPHHHKKNALHSEMLNKQKEIIDDRYGTRTHNLGLRRATRYHCANRPVLLVIYEESQN